MVMWELQQSVNYVSKETQIELDCLAIGNVVNSQFDSEQGDYFITVWRNW